MIGDWIIRGGKGGRGRGNLGEIWGSHWSTLGSTWKGGGGG